MIVPEKIIAEIVATIPAIQVNAYMLLSPKYGDGDKKELNRWLSKKKDENAYPLVWLLPAKEDHQFYGKELVRKCQFIIATRESNEDLFNSERYLKAFDIVLLPLTEMLIQGLTRSQKTSLVGQDWTISKYPNYSEVDENFTIDLWDALKLDIEIRFNNNKCLGTINYGKV